MATYVYDPIRQIMVDKATREPMVSGPWKPVTPMHIPDIQPYLSPVDGKYVSGRKAKQDDLKRNNCVDAADLPSPTGGKLRNKKFAKKWNMEHHLSEEAR